MSGHVRVGGAWKTVVTPSVKVGGAWKTVTAAYTKVGGAWKQWFSGVLSWSLGDLGQSDYHTAGAYTTINGGTYFFFMDGTTEVTPGNGYIYSTNGVNWTTGTLPASVGITGAAFNGTTLTIVAGGSNTDDAFTTTNGTTWTLRDTGDTGTGGNEGHSALIWDGTRFIATSNLNNSTALRWSTDGATWTQVAGGTGSNGFADIAFDGSSRYIAIAASATATQRTCTSNPTVAANWTNITLPTSTLWIRVVYGNGIWIALRPASTNYATSTDGTTWTSRTLPFAFGPGLDDWENRSKMVFYNDSFYYGTTEKRVYRSTDGINWTMVYDYTSVQNSDMFSIAAWITAPTRLLGAGYWRIHAAGGTPIGSDDYVIGQ